jgi:flagellar biosynthetic protein FliR
MTLSDLAAHNVHGAFLVFCRIGGALMLLPGFGEIWLSARVRLAFAGLVSLAILPMVSYSLPAPPAHVADLVVQVAHESLVGLWFGTCVRIITASMHIAGSVIAMQGGMSNALLPGAVSPDATAIVGAWLGVAMLAFVFSSGLDHYFILALANSYSVISPPVQNLLFPMEDLSEILVRTVSRSFALGIQLSMPFLASGLAVTVAFGLANRFMPQLQAYFLSVPATIVVVCILLGSTIGGLLSMVQEEMIAFLSLFDVR